MKRPNQPRRDPRKMWELFTITLQLGAFTFGGGYAMFPLMRREYVEKRNWFTDSDMLDMLAVSQSLPGMISVNASIMVGYRLFGLLGALVAVLGLVLPSLVVLSIISFFYVKFQSNPWVNAALSGIRVGVIALLIQAVIQLGKPSVKGAFAWILAITAFILSVLSGIHPILIILAGAFVGILRTLLHDRRKTGLKP